MTTSSSRRRTSRRAKKSSSLRCIVRIETGQPRPRRCWEVKIIRPGNSFYRSFSDSKYGGRAGALKAAMQCRDVELKKRPPMTAFEQAMRLKKTNKSGIVGVRRTTRKVRRGKKVWSYDVWAVTGTPVSGGKTMTRYFPMTDGVNKAKARAVALRKSWEASLRKSVAAKQD